MIKQTSWIKTDFNKPSKRVIAQIVCLVFGLIGVLAGHAHADITDSGNGVVGGTFTVTGNAFSVGGSTFVVKSGSVGIGTMNPATKLEVDGTASIGGTGTAPTVSVSTGGSVAVGINTLSSLLAPSGYGGLSSLVVQSPQSTNANYGLQLFNAHADEFLAIGIDSTKARIGTNYVTSAGSKDLELAPGNVDAVYIKYNSGNPLVGISTTNPATQMELVQSNTGVLPRQALTLTNSAAGGYGSAVSFRGAQNFGGNSIVEAGRIQVDGEGNWGSSGAISSFMAFYTVNGGTLQESARLTAIGKFGVGTNSPDQLLSVNGNADKATGGTTWGTFSDSRLKDVHGPYTLGLEQIMKLNPIRFRYKKDNPLNLTHEKEEIGFAAEEVQKIMPEAVTNEEISRFDRNAKKEIKTGAFLMLHADPILWAMLNAVKEQQKEIEDLKAQIAALQKK